jgi:hypothetical protein
MNSVEWRPWNRYHDYQEQVFAISSWCDYAPILEAMLREGHSDVHFVGGNTNIDNIKDCVDNAFSREEISDLQDAPNTTIQQELSRVAQEAVSASHFVNKEVMLGTLSATMLASAHKINQWLTDEKYRDKHYLRLTVDMQAFIGTGIHTDGNERATTAATLVLTRTSCVADGTVFPFSILTMYPDISETRTVGNLVQTGRYFGEKLKDAINGAPFYAQMYWQIREHMLKFPENQDILDVYILKNKHNAIPTTVMEASCNVSQYTASYSSDLYSYGYLTMPDPQTGESRRVNPYTTEMEVCNALRSHEREIVGHYIQRARSCSYIAIETADTLFPRGKADILRMSECDIVAAAFNRGEAETIVH